MLRVGVGTPRSRAVCAVPFPRALLTGGIQNEIHQRLTRLVVAFAETLGGHLHQKSVDLRLRPLGEDLVDLGARAGRALAQDVVDLANHLHDAVLDAVVDHFHVMARRTRPDVGDARPVVGLGSDLGQHRLKLPVGVLVSTGHDAGPPQCSLFAAADAAADEMDARSLQLFAAPVAIGEVSVAAVNDHVTRLKNAPQVGNDSVGALSRGDHQQHAARFLQEIGQLPHGLRHLDVLASRRLAHTIGFFFTPVVGDHGEAVALDVECDHLPHDT